MDFSKLEKGQRYLFQNEMNDITEYFRATYLGVHIFNKYTTLVVKNYRKETSSGFIQRIPGGLAQEVETLESVACERLPDNPKSVCFITYAKYITNAFTLVDIIENENTNFPDDVLFEINKFY